MLVGICLSAEIAEAIWVPLCIESGLPLAPLTRDIVFPLARKPAQENGRGRESR